MRKETSGNSWNFLKSPRVFSGQSEEPHILCPRFTVPYKIPYWLKLGSFVVVLLTIYINVPVTHM